MNAHLTPAAYLVSEMRQKEMLAEAERDRFIRHNARTPRQQGHGASALRGSLASLLIGIGERLQGVQADTENSPIATK